MTEGDLKIVRGEIAALRERVLDAMIVAALHHEQNFHGSIVGPALRAGAKCLESPPVKVEEPKFPPMDYWQYRACRHTSPYRRYEGDATAELDSLAKLIVSGEYAITKVVK